MIVTKRTLNSWRLRYEHGDYMEIERRYGISAKQASRAVESGKMPNKTFFSLQDYFRNKQRG